MDLTFSTNNNDNGSSSNDALTERMRITSDGKVGIGVTNPSRALDVNGDLMLRGNDILDSTRLFFFCKKIIIKVYRILFLYFYRVNYIDPLINESVYLMHICL